MAEEAKKTESKNIFSTLLKVILGLAFLALGAWAVFHWRANLLVVVKGCVGLFLILAGIITLAIAKE